MKRAEFKAWFNTFYNKTYNGAMTYCMAKTGDFVNSEDLLAEAYYSFYKHASKMRTGIEEPDKYFFKVLRNKISKYWEKHRKELPITEMPEEFDTLDSLLEIELDLTADVAMKRMLLQDILEFVSSQPALMRRAFALHFYLGRTIEETAADLNVSVSAARNYIYRTLKLVREEFLEDYE